MRLWHYKLIKYLPNSQLLGLWRELNSIFKKQDNHILINYIYDYPKSTLLTYSNEIIKEMRNRNMQIKKWDNYEEYFDIDKEDGLHFKEHDDEYLLICFYNLKEKFIRGQKDFAEEKFENLKRDLYRLTKEIE